MVQLVKTPLGFFVVALKNQVVEFQETMGNPKDVATNLDFEYKKWEEAMRAKAYDSEEDCFLDPMKITGLIGIPEEKFLQASREVGLAAAKIAIKEHIGKDYLVVQAVGALDDLTKAINLLANRAMEWYGLHYPEFKEEDMEKYISGLLKHKRGISMGLEIDDRDLNSIRDYAEGITLLIKRKKLIETYIDKLMSELSPNVKALAGANLGARLISRAGSLKRLARLPASTIQVFGAEKALFKHLQKGVPPPKHGIIFQHNAISTAPKHNRGKLARTLAAKLAIAAKIDYYSGDFRQSLVDDWNARIKEVKKNVKN
ncbi:MAG: hypothetical protein GOV00_01395 [Candidatus Altiarchaeota archaeon]|nr:hypothetical protein [Candidatus Altiarchaeota archaeon]